MTDRLGKNSLKGRNKRLPVTNMTQLGDATRGRAAIPASLAVAVSLVIPVVLTSAVSWAVG